MFQNAKKYDRRGLRSVFAGSLVLASDLSLAAHPRPSVPEPSIYLQSGDVTAQSAVLWARCNEETDAQLLFELGKLDKRHGVNRDGSPDGDGLAPVKCGRDIVKKPGPQVSAATDYTGSVVVKGLAANQAYDYRAHCISRTGKGQRLDNAGPVGHFETTSMEHDAAPVKFVWIADLAGQGWGRNPNLRITDVEGDTIQGGYVIFDVIRKLAPDFAIFAGDSVYADNPISAQKPIPEEAGGVWINEPAKDFVAITLDEFRANWKYNLGDEKLQEFLLKTPIYAQWDDHEVTNNWYPGEILTDAPYHGIAADVLAERARQAFFEYSPIEGKTLYRKFRYGRSLELFLLDERSFRGPNPANSDPNGIEMLGEHQLRWLKESLKQSRATWKVISTHDPLSIITGGPTDRDAWAQGDPRVLGRELQLRELLRFIRDERIRNVVFITADVHFAAAISYHPEHAQVKDFEPFWEFVIGPGHAGAFGANDLDGSFGPRFEYLRAPSTEGFATQNLPPPILQSFGAAEITEEGNLVVRIHDITGAVLFEKVLQPES